VKFINKHDPLLNQLKIFTDMITKWKLGNFRSVREETELDFAPLTVFAGANSSGKSTLLKSILLVAQTLSHKDVSRPLVLNGDLIKLGNIDDIISTDSTSNRLIIGWECSHLKDNSQRCRELLDIKKRGQKRILQYNTYCEIAIIPDDSKSQLESSHRTSPSLLYSHFIVNDYSLKAERSNISSPGFNEKWINVTKEPNKLIGLKYKIEDGESHYDDSNNYIYDFNESLVGIGVGCMFRHFLPFKIVTGEEWIKNGKKQMRVNQQSLPPFIFAATEAIRIFFSNSVCYIGPLRASPKSVYERSLNSSSNDIGIKGENTHEVFNEHKKENIRYIPSSCFDSPGCITAQVDCSLADAVVDWLSYLGVAENISSIDKGKYGFELGVMMGNSNVINDLTQVGIGVSQVLPILVGGLLAKPDTTLIYEQPELHLHPKVQSRLADFFLAMTQLGKQCLVETHSEHIINRIRLRIAEGSDASPWHDAAKVYFVENKNDSSTFREIKIDECGGILVWPEGFFDERQQETERILRAASQKDVKNWKDN
jgi:predicted ATPase